MELQLLDFVQESVEFERAWGNLRVATTIKEAKIAINESFLLEEEQEEAKEEAKEGFLSKAKQAIKKMIDSITEFVTTQTKNIMTAINNAIAKVKESTIIKKIEKLKAKGEKLIPFKIQLPEVDVKAAMDGIKEKAVKFKEFSVTSWENLLSIVKGLPEKIKNNRVTIAGLKKKLSEAKAAARHAVSPEGIQEAKDKISSIRQQLATMVGAVNKTIRDQIAALGKAISGIVRKKTAEEMA